MPSQRALRWQVAGFCVALAAATLVVYGRVSSFEFTNYDESEDSRREPDRSQRLDAARALVGADHLLITSIGIR